MFQASPDYRFELSRSAPVTFVSPLPWYSNSPLNEVDGFLETADGEISVKNCDIKQQNGWGNQCQKLQHSATGWMAETWLPWTE